MPHRMPWLLPILAALLCSVAWPDELDLSDLEVRIDALSTRAREVREGARPTVLILESEHESLFDRATLDWMLGDLDAAAGTLWMLREQLAGDHALRAGVDELLSDSLTALDAPFPALLVLDEILATEGHPYRAEAATRRLLLAARHHPSELAELSRRLEREGLLEPPASLAYALGRARWAMGDALGAETSFLRVPSGSAHHEAAQYHRAVIRVGFGELDDAAAQFAELTNAADARIADLARLGLARIHYENRELDHAARHYRAVSQDSMVRAEALEELAWTEIRRGFPDAAEAAVRDLALAFPGDPRVADMLVVVGRVSMAHERWSVAEEAFTRALDHLHAHPPAAPEGGPSRLVAALHDDASELRRRIDDAQHSLADVERALASPPGQRRQVELQRAARDILGDAGTLRMRLVEAASTRLHGPARRDVSMALDRLRDTPELAVPTRDAAVTRREVLTALQADARAAGGADSVLDRLTTTLDDAEQAALGVLSDIDEEIETRSTPVDRAVVAQRASIAQLEREYDALQPRMHQLATRALELERVRRAQDLTHQQSVAAAGIVDASWHRLQRSRETQATAQEDHQAELQRLAAAFRRMRARLTMDEPEPR